METHTFVGIPGLLPEKYETKSQVASSATIDMKTLAEGYLTCIQAAVKRAMSIGIHKINLIIAYLKVP